MLVPTARAQSAQGPNAALRLVTILALTLIFYPKQWVVGGLSGGPLAPGQTAYREEYACIGIKLIIPLNCADCGAIYPCFGIILNRTCSIERYDELLGVTHTPLACEEKQDQDRTVQDDAGQGSSIATVIVTIIPD